MRCTGSRCWQQTGFSLLEILIVMVIISVMTTMVTLSLAPDTHRQVQDEAYRFASILEQAVDAAEQGEPLGLIWNHTGYGFRWLDAKGNWQRMGDAFFADHTWPDGVYAEPMSSAGAPLLLWQHGRGHNLELVLKSGSNYIIIHLLPVGRVNIAEASA